MSVTTSKRGPASAGAMSPATEDVAPDGPLPGAGDVSSEPERTVPTHLTRLRSVLIDGAGLIGASIGMALQARGIDVWLSDSDPAALKVAMERGAGRPYAGDHAVDLAVVCTPPALAAAELFRLQSRNLAHAFTDVSSIKTQVLSEAETLGCDMSTLVGGHPFAGRERGGAANADAELFTDRPWVLCPTPQTSAETLLAARQLAELCGAVTVVTSPERHDAAAAWLSHVPQLLASALASGAADIGERELGLAGTGFRDLTRIADSPPGMWQQVVAGNAAEIKKALAALIESLQPLIESEAPEAAGVTAASLIAAGNRGRSLLPSKAGRLALGETLVVAVSDRPGELARLLADVAAAEVNLEDLHVQHGAAATRGLVDLEVAVGARPKLVASLEAAGWHCWSPE